MRQPDLGSTWLTVAGFMLGATATWLAYRGRAALEHKRALWPVDDPVIVERVRARITELISRPDAIFVHVEHGVVRLSGEAAPNEREALLADLLAMPGVRRVRNAMRTGPAGGRSGAEQQRS